MDQTRGFALSPYVPSGYAGAHTATLGVGPTQERVSVVRLRTSIRSRWHRSHLFRAYRGREAEALPEGFPNSIIGKILEAKYLIFR